ncbi:RING-H2 finger protein [Actinidia chinensis var. chinensis]|uniref:RING-type E3 ubiquitin transferase n=1 Tax=Actinidia chinensis var. chinensis TaxID=1590841 RepID=A0A2R6RUT9_ACTCC|nr:RING-H2 finger protein [Actinidia chinensis var. chinensis]
MDLVTNNYQIHQSQALSPIKSPPTNPHSHSSNSSFPILAVAIIGILTTAFLLVGYYVFVIKCCLNWHRIDILSRFSLSRNRSRRHQMGFYSPRVQRRGLEESVIQSIPILQFKREKFDARERNFEECAVCLNEFKEEEKLRVIPNCSHMFHVDCIDVWLQSNVNCPLCRTSISIESRFPLDQRLSPQNSHPNTDNFTGRDEDYVVIELGNSDSSDQTLFGEQERVNRPISHFPGKFEPNMVPKRAKKISHVSSMGDECIDIREKDNEFAIQPIRRSFSMDSANGRHLFLAVQEIVRQNRNANEVSPSEGSSSRIRRSFFSFGNGRGSRNAVQPIELES